MYGETTLNYFGGINIKCTAICLQCVVIPIGYLQNMCHKGCLSLNNLKKFLNSELKKI